MRSLTSLTIIFLALMTQAQTLAPLPLINTSGTSKIEVEPDEVHFNFSVITEGENLAAAKKENREIASEVLNYLKKADVDKEDVQTRYLNIGQRYRDWQRKEETKYYECSQTFQVKLTEIGEFEPIIEDLLEIGIHNLSAPDFRTSKYRELMDEARVKAVKAAKEKASAMAGALGQSIGDAYTISEMDLGQQWNPVYRGYANVAMDAKAESGGGPGIASGEIGIRATVNVAFYLQASDPDEQQDDMMDAPHKTRK